jgi:benzil reductase ((S)-benzoin forming)
MIHIITGTYSGIGYALANFYLNKGDRVIGISRHNKINHEKFSFVECDLSDKQQLHNLDLHQFAEKENLPVRLINNAGIIGDIKRASELTLTHYADMSMLNIVAPQFLSSLVLQTFGFSNVDTIVNITSGAGERSVPSWGAYCASKAAINLFAETLMEEIKELGHKTRVFNIAPGVVDTNMQKNIRNSDEDNFSSYDSFVALKENGELRSPEEVAVLFDQFLEEDHSEEEGIIHRI